MYCYGFFLLVLILIFPVLAKRLCGKSISDMICLVSSRMLNFNSINQWMSMVLLCVQEDLMVPSLFICSECKEIEEDRTNVITCAECSVGREFLVLLTSNNA